jgi:hypothetical protein
MAILPSDACQALHPLAMGGAGRFHLLSLHAPRPANILGVSCAAGPACRSRSGAAAAANELHATSRELQPP